MKRCILNKVALFLTFFAVLLLVPSLASAQVKVENDRLYFGEEVIEFDQFMSTVAEFTKVNVLMPEKIKERAKMYVIAPDGLGRTEIWDSLLWMLDSIGVTYETVGPYRKARMEKNFNDFPSALYIQSLPELDSSSPQVTLLYHLKHLESSDAMSLMNELRSGNGKIYAFNDFLLFIELQHRLPRMLEILKKLDVGDDTTRVYYWKAQHSDIADVAKILEELFLKGGKGKDAAVGLDQIVTDDRTNSLYVVGDEEACQRVMAFVPKLDVTIDRSIEMKVSFLQFAKAEELSTTLQNIVSKKGSTKKSRRHEFNEDLEVKVTADKQNNALILVGPPRGIRELQSVIKKLDRFPRQVFLEAVILEVTVNDSEQIGLALAAGKKLKSADDTYVIGSTSYGSLNAVSISATSLMGLAFGAQGPAVDGAGDAFGLGFTFPSFGVLIKMLQSTSNVNVVANPYLMGVDNEEAEVIVGSNVPFITGSSMDNYNQPVLSIQRQDVALTVKIKPEINENRRVKLKIEITIEDLQAVSEVLGPTTSKRAVKTTATALTGSRVAIGGLMRDLDAKDVEKVPFFGDLPIIGRLFRTDSGRSEKTNLMVVITPHIIETPEEIKKIFRDKLKERSEYIRDLYGDEFMDYDVPQDFHDRVGIVEGVRQLLEEQKELAKQSGEEKYLIITPNEPANEQENDEEEPLEIDPKDGDYGKGYHIIMGE